MAQQITKISADGHLHIYSAFHLGQVFDFLLANLNHNAQLCWPGPSETVLKLALLVESQGANCFDKLKKNAAGLAAAGLDILDQQAELALTLLHRKTHRLCLIAGKQIATQERLEVLGLGINESIPDGLSIDITLKRVDDAGGIAVLPWAPGKWWGQRGKIIHQLIETNCGGAQPGRLALGDSSLRPIGWPTPPIMRKARQNGLVILPGSDPLPLPGEERQSGAYGFTYEGPFDLEQPLASLGLILSDPAARINPAGRRNNFPDMLTRLYRLKKTSQQRRRASSPRMDLSSC